MTFARFAKCYEISCNGINNVFALGFRLHEIPYERKITIDKIKYTLALSHDTKF